MLVSTAVVSVRSFFPAIMAASFACWMMPLMDLFSALLAKEGKSPTQITKIRNRVLIKTGEAPIEKAGSQFAMKFAVGPTFDVFEHHTTQQPVRSNPFAASFVGVWRSRCQGLSAQGQ